MKPKCKLFVKEDFRIANPLLFKVVGGNNELLCRVEGWDGDYGRHSEYRLFNGDFSNAGSVYRMSTYGGLGSYALIFGMVVSGEAMSYRVFFNDFKKEVRYKPSYTGGCYLVEDTTLRVDALFQETFWLYDGEKELAKMQRTRFSGKHTYAISVYDEHISLNTIIGTYIGVLASVREQQGRARDSYHNHNHY